MNFTNTVTEMHLLVLSILVHSLGSHSSLFSAMFQVLISVPLPSPLAFQNFRQYCHQLSTFQKSGVDENRESLGIKGLNYAKVESFFLLQEHLMEYIWKITAAQSDYISRPSCMKSCD